MMKQINYLLVWYILFKRDGWQSVGALTLQLIQLNQEDEIMPPPDNQYALMFLWEIR